jgi:hypothetical protein
MATYETMGAPGVGRRAKATKRLQVAHALADALGAGAGHAPAPGSAPLPPRQRMTGGQQPGEVLSQADLTKGHGPGTQPQPPAPAMQGGADQTYPANVSWFGRNYRSEAGRAGTEQQHEQRLDEVLRQLPPRLRRIYLQGQAQMAFSGKHDQAFIDNWVREHSPFIPKGATPKTFPGHRRLTSNRRKSTGNARMAAVRSLVG